MYSFKEHVTNWLSESGYAPGTKDAYSSFLRFIGTWLDENDIELDDLKSTQCDDFLRTRNWANATAYHCLEALKSFLRWRYKDDHPLLAKKFKRLESPPQKVLNAEEVRKLVSSLSTTTARGQRDLVMVLLMLDTGLRAHEVCRLKARHVNLSERTLQVQTKGGKWRSKVFSDVTAAFMAAYLEDFRQGNRGVEEVFVSIGGIRPGTALSKDGLRSIFRTLGRMARIESLSPHVLRRTFATLAFLNGAPTRLIQEAGGWSTLAQVERYTQSLRPEDFDGYFATNILRDEFAEIKVRQG